MSELQSAASSWISITALPGADPNNPVSGSGVVTLENGGVYRPATTAGEVLQMAGAAGHLVEVAAADPDRVLEEGSWQLGGGEAGEIESTTADVAALLAGGQVADLGQWMTVSGSGDAQTLAQEGVVSLTGGGANCEVLSTAQNEAALLNGIMTVTRVEVAVSAGDGTQVLEACAYTPLQGGQPRASVSQAGEVAAAVSALSASLPEGTLKLSAAVSAGDGTQVIDPGWLPLTGGRGPWSTNTVADVVALLNGSSAVAGLLTASVEEGSNGTALVTGEAERLPLGGGGDHFLASGTTEYGWDVPGRLKAVTLGAGQEHRYGYDYRTRRIRTEEPGGQHTAVLFSGGLSVAEYEGVTAQTTLTSPGASTVNYVRGPDMGGGVGGLLSSERSGTRKYNLSNGRGDIVGQSDGAGELTWTASYEAYGKRTKETGTNADKQRANSKDEDATGLLNEGYRYRDIETGVWLSRDPAGFVDGPNVYAYVKQNPWTSFDPDGLAEMKGYYPNKGGKGVRRLEADPQNQYRPLTKVVDGQECVQVNHYDVNATLHWWTGYKGASTGSTWEPASSYGYGQPTSTARRNFETNNNPQANMQAWGDAANKPVVQAANTAAHWSIEGSMALLTGGWGGAARPPLSAAANAGLYSTIGGKSMDRALFNRIQKAFERKPGRVMASNRASELHLGPNLLIEGETMGPNVIALRMNPSTSSVYEELIHTAQLRRGMTNVIQMEIEAAQKLIRFADKYKIPASETKATVERLRILQGGTP